MPVPKWKPVSELMEICFRALQERAEEEASLFGLDTANATANPPPKKLRVSAVNHFMPAAKGEFFLFLCAGGWLGFAA
jgi:hypothetical protein